MKRFKAFLLIFLALACLGGLAWSEDVTYVAVPVFGAYFEPSIGDQVRYTGVVHIWWTPVPGAASAPKWDYKAMLVADARSASRPMAFTYYAFCTECFDATVSDLQSMTGPFWAMASVGSSGFQGSLTMSMELAENAFLPEVTRVAFASTR
jgi:hypothetical protein